MDGATTRPTPAGRILRQLPLAFMVMPVLWACAIQVAGSTFTPIVPAPKRPALAFAQKLVDLGEVAPTEEVMAHFDFTNRGDDVVTIKELIPSCGCLQPTIAKKIYYPGQRGHFELRVQTANQTVGAKEYKVTVKYADPEPQEVDLVFRVTLPENQVFIEPRSLAVYQWTDQPLQKKVEIVDRRGKSLNIVRVDCTRSQIARVELGDVEVDENGHMHHPLMVTIPGGLPEAKVHAMIRVFTDDPEYKMLRVPLVIESRKPQSFAGEAQPIRDPQVQTVGATDESDGK